MICFHTSQSMKFHFIFSNVLEPKEDHVLYILHPLMDRIIDIDPQNIAWLKSRADLHFGKLICYAF